MQPATLCLLLRGQTPAGLPGEVLLGRKQSGLGQGKYLGIGGKVEPGEGVRAAALRELHEECGVQAAPADAQPAALLRFHFPARPAWQQAVHVFVLWAWQGQPQASAEIVPAWFALADIPYDQMWADARVWLPEVLAGGRFDADFSYQPDNQTLSGWERRDWSAAGCDSQGDFA